MKYRRRSRLRRVAKWMGLVFCMLIVSGFLYSTQRYVQWLSPHQEHLGVLTLGTTGGAWRPVGWSKATSPPTQTPGWKVLEYGGDYPINWWIKWEKDKSWHGIMIPLWVPLLLVLVPTVILFRRDRRPKPGHCQACGYDLMGNISGVCSECGVAVDVSENQAGNPTRASDPR